MSNPETRLTVFTLTLNRSQCAFCEDAPASHRVTDAIEERIRAGESLEDVLVDYGVRHDWEQINE